MLFLLLFKKQRKIEMKQEPNCPEVQNCWTKWLDTGFVGEAVCKAAEGGRRLCWGVRAVPFRGWNQKVSFYLCLYPGWVVDILVGFQLCLEPLIDTDPFIRVSCGTYHGLLDYPSKTPKGPSSWSYPIKPSTAFSIEASGPALLMACSCWLS